MHIIFLGEPPHVRGFEPVAGPNDSWHLTVKQMIADPKLEGRTATPVQFVKLLHAVYRLTCQNLGKDNERCDEPSRVSGASVDFRKANPTGKIYPGVCKPNVGCATVWVFMVQPFREVTTTLLGQPFLVRVTNGKLNFAKRYGDLVLTQTTVAESDLLQALR